MTEPLRVYAKQATAPPGRRRLRAEAAALRRVSHPNVVTLTSFLDLDEGTELRTAHAGESSLLTASFPDARSAAAFAAGLAGTVADLHDIGLVHGRLTPDHVLVAPDGRAVLCGFSEAGDGDPTVDIRALGTLLEVVATSIAATPTRRDRRTVRALLAAAEHARLGEPPPSATEIGRRCGAVVSRLPTTRTVRAERSRPRRPVVIVAVVAVVVVTSVVWMTRGETGGLLADIEGTPTSTSVGDPGATTEPVATTDPVPTTVVAVTGIDPGAVPATSGPPPTGVRFDAGGATFAVGNATDLVVTGDWDCDGEPGAALLRPSSGEVFVFDVLAAPDQPVAGRLTAVIPGVTTIEAVDQGDGCSLLGVRHADGSPQILTVGAP